MVVTIEHLRQLRDSCRSLEEEKRQKEEVWHRDKQWTDFSDLCELRRRHMQALAEVYYANGLYIDQLLDNPKESS